MGQRENAAANLAVIATYAPDILKQLEKRCYAEDGTEKQLRKNILDFLVSRRLADAVAPGHGSSKPGKGKGEQPGTKAFLSQVAVALRTF